MSSAGGKKTQAEGSPGAPPGRCRESLRQVQPQGLKTKDSHKTIPCLLSPWAQPFLPPSKKGVTLTLPHRSSCSSD